MTGQKVTGAEVTAFLRANPCWLSENPALYRVLQPPRRLHGEQLADHMAAMLAQERARARAAESVLAARRAAAGMAELVQEAVVALIRAPDPAEFVQAELSVLLGLDSAAVCAEDEMPGGRRLPPGTVSRLLGQREVAFREHPSDTALLHGAAAPLARVDALVRLAGGRLLALASRDASRLHAGQGPGPLAFLGRALSAALERRPGC